MTLLIRRFSSLVSNIIFKAFEEFLKLSLRGKAILIFCFVAFCFLFFGRSSSNGMERDRLKMLTWNIAAINNNPFEYWLTLKDDSSYETLMNNVENFVLSPQPRKDQYVIQLLGTELFEQLMAKMEKAGFKDLEQVRTLFDEDWSKRKIISGFLKDPMIGKKRLVSMPDRVTNTIVTSKGTFYRPTPINCYSSPRFVAIHDWFEKWLTFMFDTKVTEDGKVPVQLLKKIPKAKYPAITEEEEKISIPLQILVIAIFDGIQVRMLNQLAGATEWQNLRDRICMNLNTKKNEKTLGILFKSYPDANLMFLQEAAGSFIEQARNVLGEKYFVIAPKELSGSDQNSLILLNQAYFQVDTITDLTESALTILKKTKSPVAPGDLLVVSVEDVFGKLFFLASFHGDTNGLATIPVVRAVKQVFEDEKKKNPDQSIRFLFGMDANTYEKVDDPKEYQSVTEFADFFVKEEKLKSCWGDNVNPKRHTTRNARTYMQPQLSKAASKSEIELKGDANPKDFILFEPNMFQVELVARDNTGSGGFIEGMVFPTLEFPSDHAILRTVLKEV